MLPSKILAQFVWIASAFALATRNYPTTQCKVQLKSSAPYGAYCGSQGSVKHPSSCHTSKVRSQEDCRDLCWKNSQCKSFSYDSSSKTCIQASKSVQAQGYKAAKCSTKMWDKSCYYENCPAPPKGCLGGKMKCNGSCKDLSSDPDNCGACNNQCPTRGTCNHSQCKCLGGTDLCKGACPDTQTDPMNCGSCGNICTGDTTDCAGGECVCPSGTDLCSAGCVDKQTDPNNCGSCGNVCSPETIGCVGGECICPSGTALCNDRCVNTQSDSYNCGRCGNVCSGDLSCAMGSCACPRGTTLCDADTCVNVYSDNNNCGGCGRFCSNICAGGFCT